MISRIKAIVLPVDDPADNVGIALNIFLHYNIRSPYVTIGEHRVIYQCQVVILQNRTQKLHITITTIIKAENYSSLNSTVMLISLNSAHSSKLSSLTPSLQSIKDLYTPYSQYFH